MSVQEFFKTGVPFLEGLSDEQLGLLAAETEAQTFKKGQTILFKGTSVDGVHVIGQGKVSVLVKDPKKGWVQVAELGVGEIFGETSIIEYKMAGATIKSATDGTLIHIIPQTAFMPILNNDAALKERIIALIKDRQIDRHPDKKGNESGSPAAMPPVNAPTAETPEEPTPPSSDGSAPA